MQINTGSDMTLIPRLYTKKACKPTMRKSNLQWKQFDRTVIKVMGTFEGTFETKKNNFEMISDTLVACNKDHGLLEIDVFRVDTTKLINSAKAKYNNIVLLRCYKVTFI